MEKPSTHLDPQYLERVGQLREFGAAYIDVPASAKRSSEAEPGHIWSTRSSSIPPESSAETPVWVLLLKKLPGQVRGGQLFEAAPLFHEVEMAGPHDALLPAGVFGFQCAAALGTRLTVLQESLAEHQATVPQRILKCLDPLCLRKGMAEASASLAVYTGAPYLGPSDIRVRFHEDLAQRLDYLWAPVTLALNETSIDFGKPLPSGGVLNRRRLRRVADLPPARATLGVSLLRTSPSASAATKRVPLNRWFSPETRQRRLGWLKSIRIQRGGDKASPSFAAFCETTRNQKKKTDFTIVITLQSSDGASARVALSPRVFSQVFSGDELPYDWSRLSYSITIE